jgi:hypothetical protein
VRDGVVDVWFGDTAFERRHFSTLKWYRGTLLFSGYSSSPIWRTVYLVLPGSNEQSHDDDSMQRGRLREFAVPVGFSAESRERWIAFLTLAGIPRRTLWGRGVGLRRSLKPGQNPLRAEKGYSDEFFDLTGRTVAVVTVPASSLRDPTPADRP